MKLDKFENLLTRTKEKLDDVLVPIKVREMKAKAELEMTKLEAELIQGERDVQEYMSKPDTMEIACLIDKMDNVALIERRKEQFKTVIAELFPAE